MIDETRNAPIIHVVVEPAGMPNVRANLSEYVLALRFEDNSTKADELELRVDNSDLSNFDDPVWRTGNIICVSWGYPQAMTVERRMRIRSVKGFTELTITAVGGELSLNRLARVHAYYDVTYSDVVRQIAERWGYKGDALHIEDTSRRYGTLNQANMTDAQFLRHLSRKCGFEWYIQHDGMHFHSADFRTSPTKHFRYRADGIDPEILEIRLDVDVTKVYGSAEVRSYSTEEGMGIKISATRLTKDAKAELAKLAESAGSADKIPGLDTYKDHSISRAAESSRTDDSKTLKDKAMNRLRKSQLGVVKLEMTVVGDANIYAKTVISLEGVGARLSQRYYVKSVKHIISRGYTCELECVSDGSNGTSAKSRFFPESTVIAMSPAKTNYRVVRDPDQTPVGRKLPDTAVSIGEVAAEALSRRRPVDYDARKEEIITWAEGIIQGRGNSIVLDPVVIDTSPSEGEPVAVSGQESEIVTWAEETARPLRKASIDLPYARALEPGNVDLANRPYVQNEDGSYSTVRSMSVTFTEEDGVDLTYLIPTVSDDGRLMTGDEAVAEFKRTGQHLGIYATHEEADEAAEFIHLSQVAYPPENTLGPTPKL